MGAGYAIPNAEDTPYIEELARQEGVLLQIYISKIKNYNNVYGGFLQWRKKQDLLFPGSLQMIL